MPTAPASLSGVYLPLVTPFYEGEVDQESIERLLTRYQNSGIAGIILLGTTGEAPVLAREESRQIAETVINRLGGGLPVYLGVSGNDTRAVSATVRDLESLAPDGYLITCPYYNRPTQAGLVAHFDAVVASTRRAVIVYNIPYRTGVNLSNESLFEIAERHQNVVGVKDSCGDIMQTMELLREGRRRLCVLTGEDQLFFTSLAHGGAGGILAAAHVQPEKFVEVFNLVRSGDFDQALQRWDELSAWIPLLFGEPNPAPLKSWLAEQGLIRSAECRLPLTDVSVGLRDRLSATLPKDDLPRL